MPLYGAKKYLTKPKPGIMINPLHTLSKGLIGYWLFNEGTGSSANDISGNNSHGAITNMLPNVQGSGWNGSKFGGGLQFDGINDHVNCGNHIILPDYSTFSAWIKTSNDGAVFGKSTGVADHTHLLDILGGKTRFISADGINFGAGDIITGVTLVNDNQWHHIVGTFNGLELVVYVDGNQDNAKNKNTSPTNNITTTMIGNVGGYSMYFNGYIDSACIYNRALSSSEVKQLYLDPFCNIMQISTWRYYAPIETHGAALMAMMI